MSLVTRFLARISSFTSGEGTPEIAEEHLAAAALLVHVARVDGLIDERERASLTDMLKDRLGLPAYAAERLVARADGLDRETDDVADLIDMMGHGLDDDGKRGLIGMAYRLAIADGQVGEFEDDLVWRVGRLFGFDDPDIAALRSDALARI